MSDAQFIDNDFCFACGTKNPLGLHLKFFRDGELYCTRVRPGPHWQGFHGVVHGGLQATIFDDLMANHLFHVLHVWQATVELTLRFKQPVPTFDELLFTSQVEAQAGRLWTLKGECHLAAEPHAAALSTAQGRFLQLPHPPSVSLPASNLGSD